MRTPRGFCPPLPGGNASHHPVLSSPGCLRAELSHIRSERKMMLSRNLERLQQLEEAAVIHRNVLIARVGVWNMLRLDAVCLCLIKETFSLVVGNTGH